MTKSIPSKHTLLPKTCRSGWMSFGCGRLLNLLVVAALMLGPLAPLSVLAAPTLAADSVAAAEPAAATSWVFQGPAPELNAQQDTVNVAQAQESVSGAVTAIAASPTNPD